MNNPKDVTKLEQKPAKTPADVVKKLTARIEESRLKTFETAAEAILKIKSEAAKTVKLQDAKLQQLIEDFNEGL